MGVIGVLSLLLAAPAPPGSNTCPVTVVEHVKPFAAPSPSNAARFWYGSEDLAVRLRTGGTWTGMGPAKRYRDKLFWWRKGFDGTREASPELNVTGRRLDGDSPPAVFSRATNALHSDFGGWAMLDMGEFPAAGCWELTGAYQGKTLRFVVRVE